MTPLEQAAIEYINARRASLDARQQRKALLRECSLRSEGEGPCCRQLVRVVRGCPGEEYEDQEPLPEDDWCELCVESTEIHQGIQKLGTIRGGALRRLERLAKKAQAGKETT